MLENSSVGNKVILISIHDRLRATIPRNKAAYVLKINDLGFTLGSRETRRFTVKYYDLLLR